MAPRYPCRWAVPCSGLWSWIGNVSKADCVCPQLKRERERVREERDPSVRPECSMWLHGPVRLGGAADSRAQERETPTRLAIRAQIYWSVQIESGSIFVAMAELLLGRARNLPPDSSDLLQPRSASTSASFFTPKETLVLVVLLVPDHHGRVPGFWFVFRELCGGSA